MAPISTRTLSCGMALVVEPMENVRSGALHWLVPAGVACEPEDRQGMGAMWSELLMRGSGDLDSRGAADAIDRLGAGRSAESGTYYTRVASAFLGERLPEVLPLIVDIVRRARMDAGSVEPARDLALQALESLKDDPQERAAIAARLRHHPSPINRSGLGTEQGLRALTRGELVGEWERLAVPGRSIFTAAGALDADRLAAQLEALLEGWAGSNPEPAVGGPPVRGYAHEQDQTNQVQVILVHDAPPESHPDSLLEKIVISVLSGGMSGRLFTEVREKRGLCYSVSAGYRGDRDFGSVSAYVGTTPERAQESLDVLVAELNRVHTGDGRVGAEEFTRAVTGMKSRLIFSGESTGGRAGALAVDYHRLGRARSLGEMAAEIDAVTLDQVNAYLARRSLGRMTIQTLGPRALKPPS